MKDFNLNDYVWVKLTETGINILKENYEDMLTRIIPEARESYGEFVLPEVDSEGYTCFQLWELMHIFGEHLYCGSMKLPFTTIIKIADEDLKEHEASISLERTK